VAPVSGDVAALKPRRCGVRLAASDHAEGLFAHGHRLDTMLGWVSASARRGKTTARMKGEVRQRNSVEKGADSTVIGTESAPNCQPPHDKNLSDSAEIHDEDPAPTRGGGGGVKSTSACPGGAVMERLEPCQGRNASVVQHDGV